MKRISLFLVVFGMAIPTTKANAEDVSWSYSFTSATVNAVGGTGGVNIVGLSGTSTNSNDVAAVSLQPFGTGTIANSTYNLTMHLTDTKSGDATDLKFSGVLNGPIGIGLTNTFITNVGTANLGKNSFGITLGFYIPPGSILGTNGQIRADPAVNVGIGGTKTVNQVPEPSCMILCATGLVTLGVMYCRKTIPICANILHNTLNKNRGIQGC